MENLREDRLPLLTYRIIIKAAPIRFFLLTIILMIPLAFSRQLFLHQLSKLNITNFSFISLSAFQHDQNINILLIIFKYLFFITIYLHATAIVISTVSSLVLSSSTQLPSRRQVISVPTTVKRLFINFFYILPIKMMLGMACWFIMEIIIRSLFENGQKKNDLLTHLMVYIMLLTMIPFIIVDLYITILWNIANVITVVECSPGVYGSTAIKRGREMLRSGNKMVIAVFLMCLYWVLPDWQLFSLDEAMGIDYGQLVLDGASLILFGFYDLVWLTSQTLLYYVCKSNQEENRSI